MKASAKYSALFFLFVFSAYLISGIAIKTAAYHTSVSGSDTAWETTCQKSTHAVISFADKVDFSAQDVPPKDRQPVQLTNCSTSLQILPVSNNFLLKPVQKDRFFHNTPSFLSSQVFVFQEPDPPRLG